MNIKQALIENVIRQIAEEQLDELSGYTLANYRDEARESRRRWSGRVADLQDIYVKDNSTTKDLDTAKKFYNKRAQGISLANKKLKRNNAS